MKFAFFLGKFYDKKAKSDPFARGSRFSFTFSFFVTNLCFHSSSRSKQSFLPNSQDILPHAGCSGKIATQIDFQKTKKSTFCGATANRVAYTFVGNERHVARRKHIGSHSKTTPRMSGNRLIHFVQFGGKPHKSIPRNILLLPDPDGNGNEFPRLMGSSFSPLLFFSVQTHKIQTPKIRSNLLLVFLSTSSTSPTQKVLLNGAFQDGRKLFTSYHTKTKRRNQRKEQFKALYRRLQVKKVIRKNYLYDKASSRGGPVPFGSAAGSSSAGAGSAAANARRKYVKSYEHNNQTISLLTEITFYGCEKQTRSCIGQVHNGRPFYRYLGRNTPPCCLEKLKAVFRHVVDEFENVGIRYWLDNRALRDAIELKGLAPDAYEIDLSFNGDDVQRSVALRKAQTRPHTDEAGFHWLKATDGHYFRVQYSKQNTIAVNLLPFDLSSGELVRPSGFYGWKARKFSVEFLHPMSTVLFLGKPIMCPNNVIEYLEVKKVK